MRTTSLFIAILFISFTSYSQSNASFFDWAFNTGAGYTNVKRLNYNSSGDLLSLIIVGDTGKFGTTLLTAPRYGAYPGSTTIIGKRSVSGVFTVVLKASTSLLTTGTFYDFVLDASDNIIISGTVFNTTTPYDFGNGVTLLGKGFFVAKYNAAGVAQWAKLYDFGNPVTALTSPIALGVLPNDDICFAGQNPYGPFGIVKLNKSGTELWQKTYTINGTVPPISSKNNYFLDNKGVSYFYVPVLNGSYLKVNNDSLVAPAGAHPSTVYILSFDADGNKKLFTSHRGGIGDIAVERSTGNVLIKWAQYVQNPAPFNTINFNANNQYQGIVVVDSTRKYIKSSTSSFLLDADIETILPLGNFKFAGNSVVQPTVKLTAGTQTFTATKYTPTWKIFDSNLSFTSFVAHPEIIGTSGNSIKSMSIFGNKLAVAGTFDLMSNPSIKVNGTTLITCEHDKDFPAKFPTFASLAGDIFIGQLSIDAKPNSISDIADSKQIFSIAPNPTNGNFTLKLEDYKGAQSIQIFDITGKVVFSQSLNSNTQIINTDLKSGIYFVRIPNSNFTVQKIVIY
jgi:hypothetical protein